jgi:hypothetical protein
MPASDLDDFRRAERPAHEGELVAVALQHRLMPAKTPGYSPSAKASSVVNVVYHEILYIESAISCSVSASLKIHRPP